MNVTQQSKRALGSQAQLTIVTPNKQLAGELLDEVWDRIDKFEAKFSRFKTTSELSQVNAQAGTKVAVSAAFIKLLTTAVNYYDLTDGLYNPLLLPALQQAGYVGSWPAPGDYQQPLDYRGRKVASPADITIGRDWVRLPANAALDFGGCGKGYLLDQLARYLDQQELSGYCLSLGGDIICSGNGPDGQNWNIPIEDAQDPEQNALSITTPHATKQAIATSGRNKRKGANWNHLIDPRTNLPTASDLVTVSVLDPSALVADIYAKCLLIVGSNSAESWATSHHIRGAVLQSVLAGATQITKLGDV